MVSEPYFLGVDLGGSQMRMAAVTREGGLRGEMISVPTGAAFAPEDLRRELRALVSRVRQTLNGHSVAALGFGTAGVVTQGPLTQSPNLPRLEGTDVVELVREAAGCPVAVENDARCFTLAEARFGAARGAKDVCGLTLGTGVGCGVMIGGRLHRGATAQAGEVYHIQLRGQSVENFVSGAGLVRTYVAAGGCKDDAVDAAVVAERARAGEAAAVATWESFGRDLGFLCEAIIGLLDPDVIVIGGSMSRASDLYKPALLRCVEKHSTRIADAELGTIAGVVGAAALNIS
jgi:glucokinase